MGITRLQRTRLQESLRARLWNDAEFRAFLTLALADPHFLMAATTTYAYFDESERKAVGIFTVAGCLFDRVQALRFKKRWDKLWEPWGGCHMKDFVPRHGPYQGISNEDHDRLIKRSVTLLTKYVEQAVAVTCESETVEAILQAKGLLNLSDGFLSPYGVCASFAIGGAMNFWRERANRSDDDRVFYILEAGHKNQAEVDRFLQAIKNNPFAKSDYAYKGHVFLEKEEQTLLQSADFFAWEWGKFVGEVMKDRWNEPRHPMRKSLAHLWGGWRTGNRGAWTHLGPERLAAHLDIVRHVTGDQKDWWR